MRGSQKLPAQVRAHAGVGLVTRHRGAGTFNQLSQVADHVLVRPAPDSSGPKQARRQVCRGAHILPALRPAHKGAQCVRKSYSRGATERRDKARSHGEHNAPRLRCQVESGLHRESRAINITLRPEKH